jgi:DNA sulfur modification protein DndD
MILDEITLHNFGLYADRQTITLTPPSPDKPVILFGGMNGGGKTTLLDALQLCLFGPHARISNRGSLAYPEYLGRCIHRGSRTPEAAIELSFRHTVEGKEDEYRLHRSWRKTNGVCKEHFDVLKNGHLEPALADNWASQVEDFIPANIAHLFLFDGEQIEGYASQENSSALIGAAIQNLLGLDMVDQLDKDLVVYERRKRTEEKETTARTEIDGAESELRDLLARAESLKQERASVRTLQLDRKRRALVKLEEKYRKLGGELYDQRVEIERRWVEAERNVRAGAGTLREVAGGALPLLIVRALLGSAASRDRHEADCRQARDLVDALKERDRALLAHMRSKSAARGTIEALKEYLQRDREERQALGKKETILDLPPDVRNDLHALLSDGLQQVGNDATRQLRHQKTAEAHARRIRSEHESVPSSDAIAEIAVEREATMKEIAALEAQYAGMANEIERIEREVERKQQALARLLEADVAAKGARDDRARILLHSEKVRTTLGAFRRQVVQRHVSRIEQLVLESYQQLLRKSSLVTRLAIDPERFVLTLYDRDGDLLSPERLSAGERQLLAIALLWGLAKASGRPLPTAIDTPLGRLDTVHRMHLVERYLPFASHQVLLLSTDEEITGEYLESLRPWIGRTYQMAYDDRTGQTQIVPGYFQAREAA